MTPGSLARRRLSSSLETKDFGSQDPMGRQHGADQAECAGLFHVEQMPAGQLARSARAEFEQ